MTSIKYGRFTLIGLTFVRSDPVVYVILTARQELTYDELMGVDVGYSFDKAAGFELNLVPGKTHIGSPKCIFHCKDFTALVTPTPKESITSKILADILNRLDNLGVFPSNKDRNT